MKKVVKYIKWILLIILIICFVILSIKFINYDNNDNRDLKDNQIFDINDIYGYDWYMSGLSVYKNGELVIEDKGLISVHYMKFNDSNVVYCNSIDNKCDKYNYLYKDEKMTIESDDYFVPRDMYDVEFVDNILQLSILKGTNKYIYYFKYPIG